MLLRILITISSNVTPFRHIVWNFLKRLNLFWRNLALKAVRLVPCLDSHKDLRRNHIFDGTDRRGKNFIMPHAISCEQPDVSSMSSPSWIYALGTFCFFNELFRFEFGAWISPSIYVITSFHMLSGVQFYVPQATVLYTYKPVWMGCDSFLLVIWYSQMRFPPLY